MTALMEGLGGELMRPSREISEYGLAGCLDAAIRASSAQYDNPDVHNRLRIRLEHGAGSETGTAVLSSLQWPPATFKWYCKRANAVCVTEPALWNVLSLQTSC